jgi:hypothetical protein
VDKLSQSKQLAFRSCAVLIALDRSRPKLSWQRNGEILHYSLHGIEGLHHAQQRRPNREQMSSLLPSVAQDAFCVQDVLCRSGPPLLLRLLTIPWRGAAEMRCRALGL